MTDCSATLLRVHLPRHHVLPILLLRPRLGSWSNRHDCGGAFRAVHVLDRLVSGLSPNLRIALIVK